MRQDRILAWGTGAIGSLLRHAGHDAAGQAQGIDGAMAAFNRAAARPNSGLRHDLAVRCRPTDAAARLALIPGAARRDGMPIPRLDRPVPLIGSVRRRDAEIDIGLAMKPANDLPQVAAAYQGAEA